MSKYVCECGYAFNAPINIKESHRLGEGFYTEKRAVCPNCFGTNFDEAVICTECGKEIKREDAFFSMCRPCAQRTVDSFKIILGGFNRAQMDIICYVTDGVSLDEPNRMVLR